MGKAERDKGRRFEQKIAREIRERLGIDVKRGQQGRSGSDCADLEADGLPYWFELKSSKRNPGIHAAIKQSIEATDGRPPVVISKRDHEPALATMLWADWLDLIHKTSIIYAAAVQMMEAQKKLISRQEHIESDTGTESAEVLHSPVYDIEPDLDDDGGSGVLH